MSDRTRPLLSRGAARLVPKALGAAGDVGSAEAERMTSSPAAPSAHAAHLALENLAALHKTFRAVDESLRSYALAVEGRLELAADYCSAAGEQIDDLRRRLAELEERVKVLTAGMEGAETQTERLMSLYVATCQLHSTLDLPVVRRTIGEIIVNLLGVDRYILLLRDGEHGLRVAIAEDPEGCAADLLDDDTYRGGDSMVDAALAEGRIFTSQMAGSRAVATVPLQMQDDTVGVLVLLKLLDHKQDLTDADRELLELLGAQTASALVLAQEHSSADRKLRTLESLVRLVRNNEAP